MFLMLITAISPSTQERSKKRASSERERLVLLVSELNQGVTACSRPWVDQIFLFQ